MYKSIDPNILERAGSFKISQLYLISYASADGSGALSRMNIRELVREINIYEHLENTTLSGNIVITDATNVLQNFPVTGYERLEFKLETPGLKTGYDFSVESGYPMFVYAIDKRQQVNPRTQSYIIRFCSMENIKNQQRRVSKSLSGSIDQMMINIMRNDLKSKKNIIIEETRNLHKYVFPRLKPFDAIKLIAKDAKSKSFENGGFHFYEDAVGFHFKSYESMFCIENGKPRAAKAYYTPKVKNIRNGGNRNILSDYQSVDDYKIISQCNTLKNLQLGTYASRMVSHDSFNKTFDEYDFNYLTDYPNHKHLEMDANGGVRDDNGILPLFNFEEGNTFGNFAEGTLHFGSNTRKIHNDFEFVSPQDIIQQRISQKSAISSLVIEITIPGWTGINVGQIVEFHLPKYAISSKSDVKDTDPYISGRYLVSGLRHQISADSKMHRMVLELIKDSYNRAYTEEDQDLFTNNQNDTGDNFLQYEIDKLF